MIQTRLSVMMFLQFFTWGAWGPVLSPCFSANGLSDYSTDVLGTGPLAAMIAPLFLGLVADRFLPSQVVFGTLMALSAAFMYFAIGYAEAGDGGMVWWMFLGHMLCYMPTLGVGNTIAFANIGDPNRFPSIRVWGTIGWIAAGILVGALGWAASFKILWLSVFSAIALAVYSFTLPHTPPPAAGKPIDLKSLLMVDAFRLMAQPAFAVFILCSTLICMPLAYYYAFAGNLLVTTGFEAMPATMTLSQISEVGFMVLIPFFFRRLGVKWMILIGMGAWVARYLLFSIGAPDQITWMLLLGLLLHGVCYDFFFVTGFMYSDQKAEPEARGQVQSLLVFFTQGVGMFFGFMFAGWRYAETMKSEAALASAIKAARGESSVGFFQAFGKMFSRVLPDNLDGALVAETMAQWKEFWLLPAYMAAAILVLFAIAFWDRVETESPSDEAPAVDAADA